MNSWEDVAMKTLAIKNFSSRTSIGVTGIVEKTLDLNRDTEDSHQLPEQLRRCGREDFGSIRGPPDEGDPAPS